jgi:hypothetical protein
MSIVALNAKAGAGKTTVAQFLRDDYGFNIVSIAEELKKECSEISHIPIHAFYDQNFKDIFYPTPFGMTTPRLFMQWWGTDIVRTRIDKDYWIKKVVNKIDVKKRFCIDDMRFKNEMDFIKKYNGLTVRINPYHGFVYTNIHQHVSETDLDDAIFDIELYPEKGLMFLQECSKSIAHKMKNKNW